MNDAKLYRMISVNLIAVFLIGCIQPSDKNYQKNIADMNHTLMQSTVENQRLANEAKTLVLPASVTAQMMPSFTALPGATDNSVSAKFDVKVNNVTAKEFFSGLAQGSDCSLILAPNLSGNISLDLKQVTLLEVLKAVSNLYGYHYEKTNYGYNIYPKELETRIFLIDKLTLQRTLQTNTQVDSSSGDLTTAPSNGSSMGNSTNTLTVPSTVTIQALQKDKFWQDLVSTIAAIIGAQIDHKQQTASSPMVQVSADTGMVVVRADSKNIQIVEKYISKMQNILGRQVIIEAEILDVELATQYSSGIDWGILTAGAVTTVPASGTGTLSSVYTLSMSGDHNNFNYAVSLLSSQGKVSVLSKPRVSAINNQSAVIKVGADNYYVTNVQSQVATGNSSDTTTSTINLQAFFSGISLYVTPQITANGEVNLHIHPSISKVSENTLTVIVGGQTSALPVAQSIVRETDTVVHAKDGQVIILGGLMQVSVDSTSSGLPLSSSASKALSDLATAKKSSGSKNELIILLRPLVVAESVWHKELDSISKLDYSEKSTQEFLNNARMP